MVARASRREILDWVTEVVHQEFDFDSNEIRLDTHLIDDLDLDSIDAIDMAVRLEERTSISFSEEDLNSLRTIGDVVDLIDGRL